MLTWTTAKRRVLSELLDDIGGRTTAIYETLAPETLPASVNREQLERELRLWKHIKWGLDAVAIDNNVSTRDLAPLWGWLKRLILRRMVRALAISNEAHHAFKRASYIEEYPYPDTTHDFMLFRYTELQSEDETIPLGAYAKRVFEDEDRVNLTAAANDQSALPRVETPADA